MKMMHKAYHMVCDRKKVSPSASGLDEHCQGEKFECAYFGEAGEAQQRDCQGQREIEEDLIVADNKSQELHQAPCQLPRKYDCSGI